MYAPARASSVGLTVRDAFGFHAPHNTLGAAVGRFGPPPDEPPTTENHTTLYVGIGLGVLAVGGLAIYLATQKKGRRRR